MTVDPHLVALSGLPRLGPRRLTNLLAEYGDAALAWSAVRHGRVDPARVRLGGKVGDRPGLLAEWQAASARIDVARVIDEHARQGVSVIGPGDDMWPECFDTDPEPPVLLFVRGDGSFLSRLSVAVVGTRRCTAAGASVAKELGHDLALAGVGVVSGLALGIDGAAHRGALAGGGPVVGVVATGLDVVYPARHADLWEAVAVEGVLVSESPLGTNPERWRFPARNRLIAALATAVVVVESRQTGGSMRTVESAIERQTDVLAVPGSVRSPASDGPNQLLFDGCPPVRDVADILVTLGTAAPSLAGARPAADVSCTDPVVLALAGVACSLDGIIEATGLPFAEVAGRLASLELAGVVERVAEGYQQRMA